MATETLAAEDVYSRYFRKTGDTMRGVKGSLGIPWLNLLASTTTPNEESPGLIGAVPCTVAEMQRIINQAAHQVQLPEALLGGFHAGELAWRLLYDPERSDMTDLLFVGHTIPNVAPEDLIRAAAATVAVHRFKSMQDEKLFPGLISVAGPVVDSAGSVRIGGIVYSLGPDLNRATRIGISLKPEEVATLPYPRHHDDRRIDPRTSLYTVATIPSDLSTARLHFTPAIITQGMLEVAQLDGNGYMICSDGSNMTRPELPLSVFARAEEFLYGLFRQQRVDAALKAEGGEEGDYYQLQITPPGQAPWSVSFPSFLETA